MSEDTEQIGLSLRAERQAGKFTLSKYLRNQFFGGPRAIRDLNKYTKIHKEVIKGVEH